MDHLRGLRGGSGGRGLGIPPPEKFAGRGHFVVPPSRTMPAEESSDMDESSDTEEEMYRGYSIDSSPQDDILRRKIPNGDMKQGRQQQYSSDGCSGYSEFSSSREAARPQQQQLHKQRGQGISNGYAEEEEEDETDSGGSSGFVGKLGRGNGAGGRGVTLNSQGKYYRSVPFQDDVKLAAKEVCLPAFLTSVFSVW